MSLRQRLEIENLKRDLHDLVGLADAFMAGLVSKTLTADQAMQLGMKINELEDRYGVVALGEAHAGFGVLEGRGAAPEGPAVRAGDRPEAGPEAVKG